MNIEKGKTYKTVNGGSVRIVVDDRLSMNGKHWVGLYDGDNGEWLLTYDKDGNAYVFDTLKPELNIAPEKRSFFLITGIDEYGITFGTAWKERMNTKEAITKFYTDRNATDIRITLVEQ